jgi:hypothetical protein
MCTVIFIPNDTGCYFASLRDEDPNRVKASRPTIIEQGKISYLSPIDPLGGGTWIGVNTLGNVIILLNGAFEKHTRKKTYRKSRGLVVSELLATEMPVVEWSLMDMEDIEPYTLIVWSEGNLFQLVWDGQEKHRIIQDKTMPHIWSSSTLYLQPAKQIREDLFQNWIVMNPPISKLSVIQFFQTFTDKENGFIINRNEQVKTLSYSFIDYQKDVLAEVNYYDLQSFTHHSSLLKLLSSEEDYCFINRQ